MTISATASQQHRKKTKQGHYIQTPNKTQGNMKTVPSTVKFARFPQSIFSTLDDCVFTDNRNTGRQMKSSLGAVAKEKEDTNSTSLTL